ncbi:hypothetical protein JCM10213_005498 [Rhodosporidiobolus nylandii]
MALANKPGLVFHSPPPRTAQSLALFEALQGNPDLGALVRSVDFRERHDALASYEGAEAIAGILSQMPSRDRQAGQYKREGSLLSTTREVSGLLLCSVHGWALLASVHEPKHLILHIPGDIDLYRLDSPFSLSSNSPLPDFQPETLMLVKSTHAPRW